MQAVWYLVAVVLLFVAAIMAAVGAPRWQAVALAAAAFGVLALGWPVVVALH